jgi:hypothetical protein
MKNDPIIRPEGYVDVPGSPAAPSTFLLTVPTAYEARKAWARLAASDPGHR